MVVRNFKLVVLFVILFFVGCKGNENKNEFKTNKDSLLNGNLRASDSLLEIKKDRAYQVTVSKNKKKLETLTFLKINYPEENDFNNIKSVLLNTPTEINFTNLHDEKNKNGIIFQNFGLTNYLEYKSPYREYFPFINEHSHEIDFVISFDESSKNPLKISFKKGQYFHFGENFKWLTPKIKISDTLTDYQDYNKNSFATADHQNKIRQGSIFKFDKKTYLLFIIDDGIWEIHHLFDITNDNNIKYYILNGIYTTKNGYGDFNHDYKLDFKQRYFYLRNSIDTTQNKYKVYKID